LSKEVECNGVNRISTSRADAQNLLDYGQYNNEQLWGYDANDWYKRYLYAGWSIVITVDCDQDLTAALTAYRYYTHLSTRVIQYGDSYTLELTASSSGTYYFRVALQYIGDHSGDYYDVDWYVVS